MKKYQYQTCFAELTIKPMVSAEKDKCLALASLEDVKHFLPNIDTEGNLDLLPIAFNACVVNRVNKNKDVIDTASAIGMYKRFIHKPINVEHNRKVVVGMILTAGFSEFGSDRPLTEEQASVMTGPFNVTLGGVLWRVVHPELVSLVEESNDESSDKYLSISASWELGFTDYRIALLDGNTKNLSDVKKIISDPTEIEEVKNKLTSLGGTGKIEDLFAYRMPSYDILPLGIGLTQKPAAEVKGVAIPTPEEVGIENPPAFGLEPKDTPPNSSVSIPLNRDSDEVGIVIPNAFSPKTKQESHGESENKISQLINPNVKIERTSYMKFTSINDITDETLKLKECTASVVAEFITSELTKGSKVWEQEKTVLDTKLSEAKANSEKLQKDYSQMQLQLTDVQKNLQALANEKVEREKVEKFNARMAAIAAEYDLDDDVRAALVEEIKGLSSDEDFTKWQSKAKVLLKGFAKSAKKAKADDDMDDSDASKKTKKAKADDMDDSDASKKTKAKASESTASTVSDAIDNGTKSQGGLPNGTASASPSLLEKYKDAFASSNFVITK